jgi:hypothetical protein
MVSPMFYLLCFVMACAGGVAALYAPGDRPRRGLAMALLIGALGIVTFVTAGVAKVRSADISFVPQVLSALLFGSVLWAIALVCTAAGYWLVFWAARSLRIGGWRLNLAGLLALAAFVAVMAALGQAT